MSFTELARKFSLAWEMMTSHKEEEGGRKTISTASPLRTLLVSPASDGYSDSTTRQRLFNWLSQFSSSVRKVWVVKWRKLYDTEKEFRDNFPLKRCLRGICWILNLQNYFLLEIPLHFFFFLVVGDLHVCYNLEKIVVEPIEEFLFNIINIAVK